MITSMVAGKNGVTTTRGLDPAAIWVDLCAPDDTERKSVEPLGAHLDPADTGRLRPTRRPVADAERLDLAFSVLPGAPLAPLETVVCQLLPERLVTMHTGSSKVMDEARALMASAPHHEPHHCLLAVLEASVDQAGEVIAGIGVDVDRFMSTVFEEGVNGKVRERHQAIRPLMHDIGARGTDIMRVEEALTSLKRLAAFIDRHREEIAPEAIDRSALSGISADVDALLSYAGSLTAKVEFLLDAMLGAIAHDQNQITLILSLTAAMFLPPTLIASIFGMNFVDMPGLKVHHGFMLTLGVMVVAAGLLAAFFRWRRWI